MTDGETAFLALTVGAGVLFLLVVLLKGLPYLGSK